MARLRVRIVHQVVNWCEPIVQVANHALSTSIAPHTLQTGYSSPWPSLGCRSSFSITAGAMTKAPSRPSAW